MQIAIVCILHDDAQCVFLYERIVVPDHMWISQSLHQLHFPQCFPSIRALDNSEIDFLKDVELIISQRSHFAHGAMCSLAKLLQLLEISYTTPYFLGIVISAWVDDSIMVLDEH